MMWLRSKERSSNLQNIFGQWKSYHSTSQNRNWRISHPFWTTPPMRIDVENTDAIAHGYLATQAVKERALVWILWRYHGQSCLAEQNPYQHQCPLGSKKLSYCCQLQLLHYRSPASSTLPFFLVTTHCPLLPVYFIHTHAFYVGARYRNQIFPLFYILHTVLQSSSNLCDDHSPRSQNCEAIPVEM